MIEVTSLSKTFTVHKKQPGLWGSLKSLFSRQWVETQALKAVSFQIREGEIVGLVGANGAGKTTLMKLLAGVMHPSKGSATVLGYTPWDRDNRFRRQIALIMGQKAQLWWDLPAADCFLLLKEIYQMPEDKFKSNLEYLVETLQVREQLNVQIRRLSLGERMKMELIAALLHEPKVVYLDEPTIGLDLNAQKAIRQFLLDYKKRLNPIMIVTSHYMEDIEALCERLLIIREGSIVYDGPKNKIMQNFANYKIITATLKEVPGDVSEVLKAQGIDVIEAKDDIVKIKTTKDKIADVSSFLLKHYQIADLAIVEEDISQIISSIMKGDLK